MNRYDLPEGLVQIEITESVGDMDIVLINNIAQSLISMGFRLSMDDFGTKYSILRCSLSFRSALLKLTVPWSRISRAMRRAGSC